MKEATGELNLTVIVVISIGILAAFFFTFLWPAINTNFQRTSQCRKATCNCSEEARVDGKCKCTMGNNSSNVFYCPWGG